MTYADHGLLWMLPFGSLLLIEQAMHGLAALQDLQREESIVNITLKGVTVDADKLTRALPFAARAEQSKVKLVQGAWINSALDELCFFPNGKHDDQVDSLSGGLAMLSERKRKILVRLKQMFADYSDLTEEQRDLLDELLARNQAGRFALLGMPPYEC